MHGSAHPVPDTGLPDTPPARPRWLLKRDPGRNPVIVPTVAPDEDDAFGRIRCPLCAWRPGRSARWCCSRVDEPERFTEGCGTVWDTFSTGGRCPGCQHQWRWTMCLRCGGWSLHGEWYEEDARER
jgi:hypothetical protein